MSWLLGSVVLVLVLALVWHVRKTSSEARSYRDGQRQLGDAERRIQQLTDDNAKLTKERDGLKQSEVLAAQTIGRLTKERDDARRKKNADATDDALLGDLDRQHHSVR